MLPLTDFFILVTNKQLTPTSACALFLSPPLQTAVSVPSPASSFDSSPSPLASSVLTYDCSSVTTMLILSKSPF